MIIFKVEDREKIEGVLRYFLTNKDLSFIAAIHLKNNKVFEGVVVTSACNEVATGITTFSLQLYKDRSIGGITADEVKYLKLTKNMMSEKLKKMLEG